MEHEAVVLAFVDRDPGHVGRQQVAGELDAVEPEAEGDRQRVRERGLADPGQVFEQQVAAREQAGQGETDLLVLADHDLADLARGGMQLFEHRA